MKLATIGISLLAAIVLIFAVFFRTCTGFVSSFDGEEHRKMKELTNDYYCNYIDGGLWTKAKKTDAYMRLIESKIDSLAWNKEEIIGFSNGTYFVVNISTGEIVQLNNPRIDHGHLDEKGHYNGLNHMPMPSIAKP